MPRRSGFYSDVPATAASHASAEGGGGVTHRLSADNLPMSLQGLPPPPMPVGVAAFGQLQPTNAAAAAQPPPIVYPPAIVRPVVAAVPPPVFADANDACKSLAEIAARRAVNAYKRRTCEVEGLQTCFEPAAGRVPGGWLSCPPPGVVIPNVPPKPGTGARLRPAKLPASSCVPPPYPEPLAPVDSSLPMALSQEDQLRRSRPPELMNRIVYDCILKPETGAPPVGGRRAAAAAAAAAARNRARDASSGDLAAAAVDDDGALAGDVEPPQSCRGSSRSDDSSDGDGHRMSGSRSHAAHAAQDAATAAAAAAATNRYSYFPDMPGWYCPTEERDPTLVFESRFESGNLRRVVQVYPYEYDLVLRPDINTRGHTQWFYFAITNTLKNVRYKFNIINLMKEDSLYSLGMQPLVHSAKTCTATGLGWHRTGDRIAYYKNTIRRRRNRRYFTLSFSLTFSYDDDTVHVAHCYPYTYTDLQRYLKTVEDDPSCRQRMRRAPLCMSLAGNVCDVLTITSFTDDADALRRRKGVILSARVHPGETNASWMMKGALDFLLGPSLDAKILRDNFVFKVVPMLNPDGVIVGNYRCSLAGCDLNRCWNEPSRKLHPTLYYMRAMAKQLIEEREVVLFCDLHGHSRKFDVFIYGCEKKPADDVPMRPGCPVPGTIGGNPAFPIMYQEKMVPLLLHHAVPDTFAYRSCNFKVQRSKAGTGRVVMFREFGLVNSFTLEASFCGTSTGRWARQHFNTSHLEAMGAAVPAMLLDYWCADGYGFADLLGELDFMHPANGEAPPRFMLTADGQLVEVEDDDDCTDSDDESSGDEQDAAPRGGAKGGSGPVDANGHTSASGRNGGGMFSSSSRFTDGAMHGSEGGAATGRAGKGGRRSSLMVPSWQQGGQSSQGTVSDSEVVTARQQHKRQVQQFHRSLLKVERDKAAVGLAACLPMIAARARPMESDSGSASEGIAGPTTGTASRRNSSTGKEAAGPEVPSIVNYYSARTSMYQQPQTPAPEPDSPRSPDASYSGSSGRGASAGGQPPQPNPIFRPRPDPLSHMDSPTTTNDPPSVAGAPRAQLHLQPPPLQHPHSSKPVDAAVASAAAVLAAAAPHPAAAAGNSSLAGSHSGNFAAHLAALSELPLRPMSPGQLQPLVSPPGSPTPSAGGNYRGQSYPLSNSFLTRAAPHHSSLPLLPSEVGSSSPLSLLHHPHPLSPPAVASFGQRVPRTAMYDAAALPPSAGYDESHRAAIHNESAIISSTSWHTPAGREQIVTALSLASATAAAGRSSSPSFGGHPTRKPTYVLSAESMRDILTSSLPPRGSSSGGDAA